MRLSDIDRKAAADRLGAAVNEGRLSVSEYDDRLGRLYHASTYADLAQLLGDLPATAQRMPMPQPMPMQTPWQQPMMPMPMQQPMTGPIAGPAAVVNNTIVVPNQIVTILPASGWATAALVLGILGLTDFWVPFGGVFTSALAVAFAIAGLKKSNSGMYGGHGRAVAGLVLGGIGLIPAFIFMALFFTVAAAAVG